MTQHYVKGLTIQWQKKVKTIKNHPCTIIYETVGGQVRIQLDFPYDTAAPILITKDNLTIVEEK